MRQLLVAGLLVLVATLAPARAAERGAFAQALAHKLVERRAIRPQTHTTDFRGGTLGCITLTTFELREFGYRGHAFLCEVDASAEVLGAVLSRRGGVRCYISGAYVGDGCYDFTICGVSDSACVQ